ncbi:methyltransferase domain-containing protein [Xylariaceae sp. FL0255]|nr:methyltransferase domain-containing protein [Xylariaceae sp. FL0255]
MAPSKPLPYSDHWNTLEEYVDELLKFVTTSHTHQILCGGVHLLDFFTTEKGLFGWVVPDDWQPWLLQLESMRLVDFLLRDDLESLKDPRPPESLIAYVKDIRRLSLGRDFSSDASRLPKLSWPSSVGMKPKKIHEVRNFASYIDQLAIDIEMHYHTEITHFVDFGSGQNYLGRSLAQAPYNKQIVAVEGREHNIVGAKGLDMVSGAAVKPKIIRNKKLFLQKLEGLTVEGTERNERYVKKNTKPLKSSEGYEADLGPRDKSAAIYTVEEGRGFIRYIEGRLESGDLSDVVEKLSVVSDEEADITPKALSLMAISIHSCGNLSHHGIRSLIMNPTVRAIAIVGCCYNLMTEKLGPPTYKHPYMRATPQPLNGRIIKESSKRDPQGFPMSDRLCDYQGDGVRLNITARMMACQAPSNWTEAESDGFFLRHFYRAVLQKIFLDRGVISLVYHDKALAEDAAKTSSQTPFMSSTNPVILGSLGKSCFTSLRAYVRGAIKKLTTVSDYHEQCDVIKEKMGGITDEEIDRYEREYLPRKREVSAIWTLMAFSAQVVESLIVTDRWLFLRQHPDLVQDCWVETVFDYQQSPRNLVVVGIKTPEHQ